MANNKRSQTWEEGVGERIRRARGDARIIQKVIADACGVSIPAVSNWESGKTPAPAFALVKIAQLTNSDLTWLLTGKSNVGFGAVSTTGGGTAVPRVAWKDAHDFEKARESSKRFMVARTTVGPKSFALTVQDRANAERLQVGDEVVFDPDVQPEPERFVLALIGKDRNPVIRCYEERGGHVALVPANKAWKETLIRSAKDGIIVATLVEFSRAV